MEVQSSSVDWWASQLRKRTAEVPFLSAVAARNW
jgi:hypothetical protein